MPLNFPDEDDETEVGPTRNAGANGDDIVYGPIARKRRKRFSRMEYSDASRDEPLTMEEKASMARAQRRKDRYREGRDGGLDDEMVDDNDPDSDVEHENAVVQRLKARVIHAQKREHPDGRPRALRHGGRAQHAPFCVLCSCSEQSAEGGVFKGLSDIFHRGLSEYATEITCNMMARYYSREMMPHIKGHPRMHAKTFNAHFVNHRFHEEWVLRRICEDKSEEIEQLESVAMEMRASGAVPSIPHQKLIELKRNGLIKNVHDLNRLQRERHKKFGLSSGPFG